MLLQMPDAIVYHLPANTPPPSTSIFEATQTGNNGYPVIPHYQQLQYYNIIVIHEPQQNYAFSFDKWQDDFGYDSSKVWRHNCTMLSDCPFVFCRYFYSH